MMYEMNDITNPKEEKKWRLQNGEEIVEDELEIAETFNKFFVDKINNLKENIDVNQKKEPLTKLKEKMKGKNLKFELRTVSEKKVRKAMMGMKKKKSSGPDGISQENLILGTDWLVIPLTRIINGEFPEVWKEAIVTPLLKRVIQKKRKHFEMTRLK